MSERTGLTPTQRNCFRAIEAHIAAHGSSPSYEDLRVALGQRSKGAVARLLEILRARGWITYQEHIRNSIRIVPGATTTSPAYVLPPQVEAALQAHCAATGDKPADVVADFVALMLDDAEKVSAAA